MIQIFSKREVRLKGQSANFSTFNMLIYAVDEVPVQNLCPI